MRKSRISRRGFLRGAALGAAAVSVQPILSRKQLYAAPQGTPGRFMVVINCLGGSDGLNVVVPAHLQSYVDRRPNINLVAPGQLPSGQALRDLDGRYKLHYSLVNLKQIWDDGDLHIVHNVSYPNPNQSHFTSQDVFSYGVRSYEQNGDGRGWLGRFADAYCASPVEPLGVIAVGVGKRRDFESDVTDPLILSNVTGFRIDPDARYASDHALRIQTIRDTLATDPVPSLDPALTIFNTNVQAYELVERVQAGTADWVDPGIYPSGANTTLSTYLKTVSQLLYGIDSFGTKVFYTGFGGFDTHSGQHSPAGNARQEQLMEQLDGALGAFAADMKAKNLWNRCAIVVISEFGRRVYENGSVGTDHGHGNAFLVLGGGVKGKFSTGSGMTGDTLESDLAPPNTVLPFRYDFRDVYADIMAGHLGLPDAAPTLFPDQEYVPAPGDIDVV